MIQDSGTVDSLMSSSSITIEDRVRLQLLLLYGAVRLAGHPEHVPRRHLLHPARPVPGRLEHFFEVFSDALRALLPLPAR